MNIIYLRRVLYMNNVVKGNVQIHLVFFKEIVYIVLPVLTYIQKYNFITGISFLFTTIINF